MRRFPEQSEEKIRKAGLEGQPFALRLSNLTDQRQLLLQLDDN
jgi:hypothetical protein